MKIQLYNDGFFYNKDFILPNRLCGLKICNEISTHIEQPRHDYMAIFIFCF